MEFELNDNKVVLRSWQMSDLDSLIENGNDTEIARFMTNKFPNPYTKEKGEGFIKFANSEGRHKIFAIEVNGKACGGIGLHPQDDVFCKNAELGYWIGRQQWGKGIISECIPLIIDYGFKYLDIDRIYAVPFSNNPGSKRVLEKSGFIQEALLKETVFKLGEKLDEYIFAIRRLA